MRTMGTTTTALMRMITNSDTWRSLVVIAALWCVGWLHSTAARGEDLPAYPLEWQNSIGMRLAYIPAGKFRMGSPPDEPGRRDRETQHEVELSRPYYLGVHEVTQAQYAEVMGKNVSSFASAASASSSTNDQRPVEHVSWDDAVEFCNKLTQREKDATPARVYRLPTEAEWEYAARAGGTGIWCFGSDKRDLDAYAWYRQRTMVPQTYPVGQKLPNPWGLYDVHGNVWEWCSDWYADDYGDTGARSDPAGPETGKFKVIRGGAYLSIPANTRSANRFFDAPQVADSDLGFRVLLEIVPDPQEKTRRRNARDARPVLAQDP